MPWDVGGELVRQVEALPPVDQQAAAAVVGGFLLLVAVVALYLWLKRSTGERFAAVLAEHDEVAVLLHPNPDADAMASALGVAQIAEFVGTDLTLQFPGQVRRQENRAFRTVLDVELEQLEHVSEIEAEAVVLVDHNEPRGFTGADGVLASCVIDHHPGGGAGQEFTDVRTEYGACSSIITEYLRDIGARPVPPDRHDSEVEGPALPTRVATGLLYGILSDTSRLTRGVSPADFDAASYLHYGVDEDLLTRIADPEVSTETLEVKARSIAGRVVRGSFAVSDVGAVTNPDAIPQAADELVGLEGVTAVVVLGERDGTVHLSGRSRDDRVHMGRTLGAAIGNLPNASAGGHARMGGGQIQPAVQADGTREVSAPRGEELLDRLFDAMSGDV